MAPYALLAQQAAQKQGYNPRIVLDQHNAVFQVPRRMAEQARNFMLRWLLEREARVMARYEIETCRKFDRVVWVTGEDQEAVSQQASVLSFQTSLKNQKQEMVIPICIDPATVEPVELREDSQEMLFLGGMHWPPNADGVKWFAREVFPLVKAACPAAQLVVVGKQPPDELGGMEGIITTGYVDEAEPYWQRSRVFIVPLRAGGGMRVKILDAWAHGVPVVSTATGAEGIRVEDGKDLLLADSPHSFAEAVLRLLADANLAQQIGRAGRLTVEREYNWRTVYRAWDEIYAA